MGAEMGPDVAAGILESCSDLCELAMHAKMDMLASLLSMAMLEAAKNIRKQAPAETQAPGRKRA